MGLHSAWLDVRNDWGPGVHEDGFGLQPCDDTDSFVGFVAWVARLTSEEALGHCTYRWIVDGEQILGGIALRHNDGEFGHIGYGIRPSGRGRGVATWALANILDEARSLGLNRLLIVCAADNIASAKVIERNGGVPEGVTNTEYGPTRRYRISIAG